jgi:hypothetical protein
MKKARSTWPDRVSKLLPEKLVFVDECGTNISLTTLYAWAPKGKRALGKAPRNWGNNLTLSSLLTLPGRWKLSPGATWFVEGATDTRAFETYVEHFLCTELSVGGAGGHHGQPLRPQRRKRASVP